MVFEREDLHCGAVARLACLFGGFALLVLVGVRPASAAGAGHSDIVVAVDGDGRLLAFTDALQPFRVPPSRTVGIGGYADAAIGFRSLDPSEQTATVRPLDSAAHLAFELIYADPGVSILRDDGGAPMRRRDFYKLGQAPFDNHPMWILAADARRPSTVTLRVRDRARIHDASAALSFSLTPDPFVQAYLCPLRCEAQKAYPGPGRCPVCGLPLTLASAERYDAKISTHEPLRPGVETKVRIALRDPEGKPVGELEEVDQHPLHLFVVSADLSWFAHGHPGRGTDGLFTMPLSFARSGTYTFFQEFAPPRIGLQVAPVGMVVGGRPSESVALEPDQDLAKTIDGVQVSLRPSAPLVPLRELMLTFSFARDGAPVRDLEPFDGRSGHLVIVSQDRQHFEHVRPRAISTGPDVAFPCVFPTAGLYRVWGQFQRGGAVMTASFTLRVTLPDADKRRTPSVLDEAGEDGRPLGEGGAEGAEGGAEGGEGGEE
jgi:hypothetical protein